VASRDDHLAQARSNLTLLAYLLSAAEPLAEVARQWAVTVAFYTAVHCVEAQLHSAGLPPASSHHRRARQLDQAGIPLDVVRAYAQLQQWSEQARYLLGSFEAPFVEQQVLAELRTVLRFVDVADLVI